MGISLAPSTQRDFSHFSGKVFFLFVPLVSLGGNSSFASSEKAKKIKNAEEEEEGGKVF